LDQWLDVTKLTNQRDGLQYHLVELAKQQKITKKNNNNFLKKCAACSAPTKSTNMYTPLNYQQDRRHFRPLSKNLTKLVN